jgi:hypothetical protein
MHDLPLNSPIGEQQLAGSRTENLRASPPMFRWPWLDRLSRVHPAVPPLIFIPAITVLTIVSLGGQSLVRTVLGALGGYVFWTFCEYWIHRAVFHFEPEGGIGARLHWMVHGVHHDHPNDPLRLVMPPAVSVPLAALFLVVFVVALGTTIATRAPGSSAACASCTCATTSRMTPTGTASARPGGTSSLAPSRSAATARAKREHDPQHVGAAPRRVAESAPWGSSRGSSRGRRLRCWQRFANSASMTRRRRSSRACPCSSSTTGPS